MVIQRFSGPNMSICVVLAEKGCHSSEWEIKDLSW